ncbi:RNA-binding protein 42 isoform X1 [Dendrobium catenatum]|uniref:RNA-binding protein 42 isoform X1 n=1 Tax=Dendrobium catenatum TaxID=906689 RepID=UPI0010A0C0D4|nr:RNA-binding protein 42 isoform X1 [Dendrobium catenatum]XP_028551635.1 RNA-binding protein 42 isoform X1 [Dendrobium catenatum]
MSSESASASNTTHSTSSQYSFFGSSYFPLPFHLQNAGPTPNQPSYLSTPTAPPPVRIPSVPQVFPPSYAGSSTGLYSLPQYHQGRVKLKRCNETCECFSCTLPSSTSAQQLFQRDAQTITPEALESVKAALASSENEHKAETKKKSIPRKAAGQTWEDPTLADWPENDFRLFCGDLGNEVNDDVLSKAFSRFPSFAMARVVRDKRTGKTRGFGFVSFTNPSDLAAALKEMNGKYVGNRPIKLRKSNWKERTDVDAQERQKNYPQKKPKPLKKSVLHK